MAHAYALLRHAGQPAVQFERLRDLARHIVDLAVHPNTSEPLDIELASVAISVEPTKDDPRETRPAVAIRLVRDQARDNLGFARIGEPGRPVLAQKEELMCAIVAVLHERGTFFDQRAAS